MEIKLVQLNGLINESLIFVRKDYESQEQLFKEVYKIALGKGFVREDFLARIQSREKEFPTGMQLGNTNVAIPHTDPECVLHEFIAVITNRKPLAFCMMDDKNQVIQVEVVFILGLNQPHTQLSTLQTLMGVIQKQTHLEGLLNCKSKKEIIQYIATLGNKREE